MALQTVTQQTLPGRPLSVSMSDQPGKPTWASASRFGYLIILLFFGGLGGWAALAPLASGVNVIGTIEVDSGVKTVQHLEGGLVQQILVREGERITQGQVLMRLDPLRTDAQAAVQESSLISLVAEKARVQAEIAGDTSMILDAELTDALTHPIFGKIVESEMKLFDERREARAKRLKIQLEQLEQIKTELRSYDIRMKTTVDALALIEEELSSVQELYDKRLTTKSRLLAIKRAQTGLLGQQGTLVEAIAQTKQKLTEHQLAIEATTQSELTASLSRLNQLDPEIARRREAIGVLDDQKARIDVRAPSDGRVMNLHVKTIGQVVSGGQVLLEIVPENEAMVLDGKLKAKDIEQVKVGAMVNVRLMAFNPRLTPPVDGQLVSVTPSTMPSAKGEPVYGVTVKLDPESLRQAIGDQQLTAGMPAAGLIAVGEQTLLSYLMTPMIVSFELALREP
jgi:HlyD family type I secretion membrane fusion protein